ncbi:MAG: hypothetical protein WCC99_20750 [Candidatus Sulfotelmatobacter sp.]
MRGNSTPNLMVFLFIGGMEESAAPDVLLDVEGREHDGLVVDAGGVLVDGRGSLGTEVAIAGVEVECADVVGAVGAGELHAALDASDGIEALHKFECSLLAAKWKARWWGSESNEEVGEWGVSKWEWGWG